MDNIPIPKDEQDFQETNINNDRKNEVHDSKENELSEEVEPKRCADCGEYLLLDCAPDEVLKKWKAPYGKCPRCFSIWYWDTQLTREEKENGTVNK
jgi:predicted Zn-ribbon and HTH transcriptional regulator